MLKTKLLTWLIRPASYFSVRYHHQLRLFIQCKIVVLRKLSTDFIVQVVLEALLIANSNIHICSKLKRFVRQLTTTRIISALKSHLMVKK